MEIRVLVLWIAGLIVIVPYAIYSLLFTAQSDQYAFLIVVPLFWIFGFWGVVGPLIAAWRVSKLMRAMEKAGSKAALKEAFERHDGKEVIVDLIASENHLPKFIARRLYDRVEKKLRARGVRDVESPRRRAV